VAKYKYANMDGSWPDKSLADILKWQIGDRLAGRRPKSEPFATPRRDNDGAALRETSPHLTWIGHSSFVMRLGGKLVATDPIVSERVGPRRRNVAPGVDIERAPKIDVVTISHSHYDHLDLPSLRRIGPDALYVVPKDVGEILVKAGLPRVVELEWWQTHVEGDLRVTLVPAQHWSMRVPWDRNARLWGGFVYESNEGTAYHAGDTAFAADVFSAIGARFPRIDWAMIPIGAYDPTWFMAEQHIGPEDAGRAFDLLGARNFVAMHWGTFKLTDEPLGEPPERMRAWWRARGHDESRLWIFDIGETRKLRRAATTES
jgi:L-ascorbate metabolism protein UlaG (beta-lactamase superfamily)